MHLQVFPQDREKPQGLLRVWSEPDQAWTLTSATDEQVLDHLAEAAAERARSAGAKAITRARAENAAPPSPRKS